MYIGNNTVDKCFMGSTAVDKLYMGDELVWPTAPPMNPHSMTVNFNSDAEMLAAFPTRGFDYRSTSFGAGWTFNGMLVAGNNSSNSYWYLLTENQYNSEGTIASLTTGDVMNTKANPVSLVFAANEDFTVARMLDIGSNGLTLRVINNGTTGALNVTDDAIGTNTTVSIERVDGNKIKIKWGSKNITWTPGAGDDAGTVDGNGYVGLLMYSRSGVWCSRVTSFTASGEGYS